MSGANLAGADLSGSNLYGANLSGANLTAINATSTVLRYADLTGGALFANANFTSADFRYANLTAADLSGVNLKGASLRYVNLTGGADLSAANLSGAVFGYSSLSGASFVGANLEGAYLNQASWADNDFTGANMRFTTLMSVALTRANLSRADLSGAEVGNADLSTVFVDCGAGGTLGYLLTVKWGLSTPSLPFGWSFSLASRELIAPNVPCDSDSDGVRDDTDVCPNFDDGLDRDADGVPDGCDPNSHGPRTGAVDAAGASGREGDLLTASGTFTDADPAFSGTVTKLSGEGSVTDHGDGTWSWSLPALDDGSGTVTVQATDGTHSPAATEQFSWSAANVAPKLAITGVVSGSEGTPYSLSLEGVTDPGEDAVSGYVVHWGDGSSDTYPSGGLKSHTYVDGPGIYDITADLVDEDGEFLDVANPLSVTVDNAPPSVRASFAASVACQTRATLNISFSDAGAADGPWMVNIDWGDGSTQTFAVDSQGTVAGVTHLFTMPSTYSATVTVTDKDGGTGSDTDNAVTVNPAYSVNFLSPIDGSTSSAVVANKLKNGRVVPVKATVYDRCTSSNVTDATSPVTIRVGATAGSSVTDAVEEYAAAGQSSAGTNAFRWSTDGYWIYNLDSRALGLMSGSSYRVDMFVGTVKATEATWAVLIPTK